MDTDKVLQNTKAENIAEIFAGSAVKKSAMAVSQYFVFAILGGMFIAFGALFSVMVAGGLPSVATQNPGLVRLVAGFTFPIGLAFILIAGGGLFTSDCATLPFAFWQKKININQVIRIAIIGYLANFIGAVLVAWLFAFQSETITRDPWAAYIKNIAEQKANYTFITVIIKGIGANVMVCLAVWMAASAKEISAKIILLWLPVMAFVSFGWEHSIANMFYIPLGIMLGADVSTYQFFIQNLLPATIGNIIGGCVFVALPYYYLFGTDKNSYKTKSDNQKFSQSGSDKEKINYKILQSINQNQHGSNN
jgi:formate/nitrite transporter